MNPNPVSHVLCPTDFSAHSDRALLHAIAVAQTMGARLKVVHVMPFFPSFETPYGMAPWVMTPEVRECARKSMTEFLAPAREARVDHESEIREGVPAQEILAAARETHADLVVLGTHGRSGFDHLLLGSVAEKLIHRLPCSVMTVGHEAAHSLKSPGSIRKVVIATDFSPSSFAGLVDGLKLARRTSAEVTALHVVEHAPEPHAHPEAAAVREALLQEAVSRLNQALAEAGAGPGVTPRVAFGRPYEEILNVAAYEEADLIVVGAHGHSVLERLISGSNTQNLVRRATCPVFVARHQPRSHTKQVAAMLAPIALYSALA